MQYDATTPHDYLEELDRDWRRETLLELRQLILSAGPELEEEIRYGMLSYSQDGGGLFGLNAQKHYVSLYVGDAKKVDPDGSMLQGLNVGKGCLRFSKTVSPSATGIDAFIRRVIAMGMAGEDAGC